MYQLTCVSAFFPVKNKHGDKYLKWFENSLSVRCPYVFFTRKDTVDLIKKYRKDLPTYFIVCELEDFYTYKYKDKMITHHAECPSVELNIIWNEKIFMVQKAMQINPYNSEWFHWIDAGICTYRNNTPPDKPFPNLDLLNPLPKDKFICSSVSGPRINFHITGTSWIIHKQMIDIFSDIYKVYLTKLIDKRTLGTDQTILTHLFNDSPDLFFIYANGYGAVTTRLYNEKTS
jgi:hypothetical protein